MNSIVNCTEPLCQTTNMIWILIVRQFVIVLFSLQMNVFLAIRIISVLLDETNLLVS